MEHDPSEKYVASRHQEVVDEMRGIVEAHAARVEPVPTQMDVRVSIHG